MQNYFHYARAGMETTVTHELRKREFPVKLLTIKSLDRVGRGKYRKTVVTEAPVIRGLLLVQRQAHDDRRMAQIRGLLQVWQVVSEASMRDVNRFIAELDEMNEQVEREYLRSGSAPALFKANERVEIIEGRLKDIAGEFLRVVNEGDRQLYEIDTQELGKVRAPVDYLRAAE